MDPKEHLILHHLDDPLRILYWTVDEASILVLPVFLGLGLEHPILGLFMAGAGFWGLRNLKRRFGLSTFRHALYWYLPKTRKLCHLPPSHIREYLS